MQALTDARSIAAFDPEWCLFWSDHVRPSHFAIWAPYLRRTRYRFLIMASADRIPDAVRAAVEELPRCAIAQPYAEVTTWLQERPGRCGFLYVGSYPENAEAMDAHPTATHIWVGHGDSAKKANSHRTASVYDSVFVAGYHAVGRYQRDIRRWVMDGACAIGVPVVEGLSADPRPGPRPIRSIVYAPTFEGRTPRADYTSIDVVAPALIEAMPALRERGVTVVLRPHPGSGGRRPELKALLADLRRAGAVKGRDKGAELSRADVMISDVSGVTSEFLFTRKPVLMPVFPALLSVMRSEARLRREYPWVYHWDVAQEPLLDRLASLERSDPLAATRAAAARRLFRHHQTAEDAVDTFDLALDTARRRDSWIPVRARFEARLWIERQTARLRPTRRTGVPGR